MANVDGTTEGENTDVLAEDVVEVVEHHAPDEAHVKAQFGKTLDILGIQTRNTDTGDITFINTDYVSPKVLDIIQWYCNTQVTGFHGIYTVIFRMDNYPQADIKGDKPTPWMFFPDSLSAVCNIRGCIDVALFEAMSGDVKEAECINTWAVIWRAMVQCFFHEAHHAQEFLTNREMLDSEGQLGSKARDDAEQAADVYAQEMMIEAAKAINVEPEFTTEIATIIDDRIHEEMDAIDADDKAPEHHVTWCKNMKYMLKHGFMVHMEGDEGNPPNSYSTVKEMMHAQSGDAENDVAWLKQNPANTCAGESIVNPAIDLTAHHATPAPAAQQDNNQYIVNDDEYFDDSNWDDDGIDYGGAQSPTNTVRANNNTQFQTPAANGMQGAANVANGNAGPNAPINNPVAGPPNQFVQGQSPSPATVGGQGAPMLNWPEGMHQAVIIGLYQKLAGAIFGQCQFCVGQNQPANTPFFLNVPGIETPVLLTAEENQLVMAQSITQNGKWMKDQPIQNGMVSGCAIGKAKMMPGYELVLNDGNGGQIRRKFVPQNPWNKGATAEWARNGNLIVWIIDPDAADKKFGMRVMNNVVESNRTTGQYAPVLNNS